MKLKILLMPTIVAIIVALSIWLIYPTYSNGVDGVKEKLNQLAEARTDLNTIKKKSANVEKLFSEISALSSEKNVLYKFIPENVKEEEIVENISRLAFESGLVVSEITIKSPVGALTLGIPQTISSALPSNKNIETTVKLSGKYEKIKEFLDRVYRTDRYNEVEFLQIERGSGGGENSDPSILAVSMEIGFGVLEKIKVSDGNINDEVFSNSSLNTEVINLIKSQKTVNANAVIVDQKGKTNLFIP